jgi:S-adenosyl-L-methionine hydrolase (adenosine-forming)
VDSRRIKIGSSNIPHCITLTTDFGTSDSYVAQMKGAVLTINPEAQVIDVTHAIAPQDIRCAAAIVADVAESFPKGTIHVAVVDPGVGTARALIAVEATGQRFLAPDNGLLARLLRRHAPSRIHRLTEQRFWREPVSATFHGRDILAPVAAHWSLGVDIARFGPPIDPERLVPLAQSVVRCASNELVGEIELIDAFGNCISNITRADFPADHVPAECRIEIVGRLIAGVSRCYGEHPVGSALALIGSSGNLEVAVAQGHAAQTLHVQPGAEIRVIFCPRN